MSAERLSFVIEHIYDAALDTTLWPSALETVCAYVDGCAANIFYQDSAENSVNLFHAWGDDPQYRQSSGDKSVSLNPLFPVSTFLEIGAVHVLADVMPIAEFVATQFYREWAAPQGLLDAMYCNLERTATGASALAVRRLERNGLFPEDSKARLRLIVPHVRRAVSIGKVIRFRHVSDAGFAETLDGLAAAVMLVDGGSRLLFANAQAEQMLAEARIMLSAHGRVGAVERGANDALRAAITAAEHGDASLGVKGVAIALAGGDAVTHVAHVLSLASGRRRGAAAAGAAAAIFVRSIYAAEPTSLEILAKAFLLTPSETRVLAAVISASNIDDLAARLGIAKATVKTHLNRLYAKTRTTGQKQLIRLAGGFASPLKA